MAIIQKKKKKKKKKQQLLIYNLWPSKVIIFSVFRVYLFQRHAKTCLVIKNNRLYKLARDIINLCRFGIKSAVFIVVTEILRRSHYLLNTFHN